MTGDPKKFIYFFRNVGLSHALDPRFKDSVLTGEEAVEFRENVETWIGEHVGSEEPEVTFADLTRSPPSKKRSFLGKEPPRHK